MTRKGRTQEIIDRGDVAELLRHQKVEVLIGGEWVPAEFHAADSIATSPDESWWMDYFLLENGDTIPDDVHQDSELPPWRLPKFPK